MTKRAQTLMRPSVIVVTGMPFEARIARGDGVRVVCAQNATLAADLDGAIASSGGARGLVSFGTAGGLIPGLTPGQWVIAHKVLDMPRQAHEYVTSIAWADALHRAMPGALRADMAGVTAPVVSAGDKAALFRESGAAAADMESHIVARVAHAHGLPFVVARVVIDPASGRCRRRRWRACAATVPPISSACCARSPPIRGNCPRYCASDRTPAAPGRRCDMAARSSRSSWAKASVRTRRVSDAIRARRPVSACTG